MPVGLKPLGFLIVGALLATACTADGTADTEAPSTTTGLNVREQAATTTTASTSPGTVGVEGSNPTPSVSDVEDGENVPPPSDEELDAFFNSGLHLVEPLEVAEATPQVLSLGPNRAAGEADELVAEEVTTGGEGARIEWTVMERFDDSWDHHGLWWGYEPFAGPDQEPIAWLGYDPAFVQPEGWELLLDGCSSTGPEPIVSHQWQVEAEDGEIFRVNTEGCSTDRISVPEEGEYEVSLTIATEDGWTSTAQGSIRVEDLLVVSLGDSAASGEGNPDSGSATFAVNWKFDACHRSAGSSHARAAKGLELADPHTSVTFLSLACSGATIGEGILGPYEGIEPATSGWLDEGQLLPPQVEALARSLCADPDAPVGECPPAMMRSVDVLMIQIGINDVRFKEILFACMNYPEWLVNLMSRRVVLDLFEYFYDVEGVIFDSLDLLFDRPDPCDENVNLVNKFLNDLVSVDTGAEEALQAYEGYEGNTYGAIRRRLDDLGIRARDVVLVTYPGPWGRSDGSVQRGCGVFSLVNGNEAGWMHVDAADDLNLEIEIESVRNGWWVVPSTDPGGRGVKDRFQAHGYCAGDLLTDPNGEVIVGESSYFVGLTESLIAQFNIEGTIHPNAAGHSQTAQAILDTLASPKPDRVSDQRVTIVLDSLRLSSEGLPEDEVGPDGLVDLDIDVYAAPQEALPYTRGLDPVRVLWKDARAGGRVRVEPDNWTPLPSDLTLSVDVAPSDSTLMFEVWAPNPVFVDPAVPFRARPQEDIDDVGDPPQNDPSDDVSAMNLRRVFNRLEDGVISYGQGAYQERTISSPVYYELRYCIFVGDIPTGFQRPGRERLLECETVAARD